ncbi:glycosyltransferase family 1 protein [Trametes sanguinea]|nr:glycosyltransferase family 1 protein [Trametes sanguinea]
MAVEHMKHILLFPAQMWGHARGLSLLAGRIVRMRPVIVTLCLVEQLWDKAIAEIKSDFAPGVEEEALSRVHVLKLKQDYQADHLDPAPMRDSFLQVWSQLCAGQAVNYEAIDGSTGVVDLRAFPLSAMVIDCVNVEAMEALHKQRTESPWPLNLRFYMWTPVSTNWMVAVWRVDPQPFVKLLQEQHKMSYADACLEVISTKHGRVVDCPCLPPMYDYELEPQGFRPPKQLLLRSMIKSVGALDWTDGLLTVDALNYHLEAAKAYNTFLAGKEQRMYFAGPLIPARPPIPSAEDTQAAEALKFMDTQFKEHGARSVIYVSFGSLFWPQDSGKLTTALDVLVESGNPFIMSRPSPAAMLADELVQRLVNHPNVFLGNWLPQQAILDHPALGWCLTHGGHNTVLECIHFKVPMILWPITVDQSTNAVYLTDVLDMAYELIEVRTGVGAGPRRRTGKAPLGTLDAVREELRDVLARAFGQDGVEKRQRLLSMRKSLEDAWTENGAARQEVTEFLDHVMALPASNLFPVPTADT